MQLSRCASPCPTQPSTSVAQVSPNHAIHQPLATCVQVLFTHHSCLRQGGERGCRCCKVGTAAGHAAAGVGVRVATPQAGASMGCDAPGAPEHGRFAAATRATTCAGHGHGLAARTTTTTRHHAAGRSAHRAVVKAPQATPAAGSAMSAPQQGSDIARSSASKPVALVHNGQPVPCTATAGDWLAAAPRGVCVCADSDGSGGPARCRRRRCCRCTPRRAAAVSVVDACCCLTRPPHAHHDTHVATRMQARTRPRARCSATSCSSSAPTSSAWPRQPTSWPTLTAGCARVCVCVCVSVCVCVCVFVCVCVSARGDALHISYTLQSACFVSNSPSPPHTA
jgi:hypothetical protein